MGTEAFATVDDLEKRFRKLGSDERDKAAALLDDAAVLILSELHADGLDVREDDETQAQALLVVSCSVVKRAMASGLDEPVSQGSWTTGPFSMQKTYANPTADLYLTKQERRMLGLGSDDEGFAFIRPLMAGGEGRCSTGSKGAPSQ